MPNLTFLQARSILKSAKLAFKKEFKHKVSIVGLSKEEWPGDDPLQPGMLIVRLENEENFDQIPSEFTFTSKKGLTYQIAVKRVLSDQGELQNLAYSGGSIWNLARFIKGGDPGTCGCVVRSRFDNRRFFLTCFHVARYHPSIDKINRPQSDEDKYYLSFENDKLAKIYEGYMGMSMDAAIAEIVKEDMSDEIDQIGIPSEIMTPQPEDRDFLRVKFKGRNSYSATEAIFHDDDDEVVLKTAFLKKRTFKSIYSIRSIDSTRTNPKTVSSNGDSGSLVVDSETNKGIGIVFGGDSRLTYVIPLHKIFQSFKLRF